MKKNEITFLPYVNQDYNAKHNRIDWVDPRAQRGGAVLGKILLTAKTVVKYWTYKNFLDRAPSFFTEEAWKTDLKLLLEEIHPDSNN